MGKLDRNNIEIPVGAGWMQIIPAGTVLLGFIVNESDTRLELDFVLGGNESDDLSTSGVPLLPGEIRVIPGRHTFPFGIYARHDAAAVKPVHIQYVKCS